MSSKYYRDLYATYSIVAVDPESEQMGVAVATHQVAVGRVVPWVLPGVGAIATQSLVNVMYGPVGLEMLNAGVTATGTVQALIASDIDAERRQVAVVDATGHVAAFTGRGCIREAGHYIGSTYSVQANMMTNKTVIDAMRKTFEGTDGTLAVRMMATLQAAQAEDGDIRGMQSAAIKIVSSAQRIPGWDSIYDLRVDEADNPLAELERLVTIRRAQIIDQEGHTFLEEDEVNKALRRWKEARDLAPRQGEIGFWQAVALADHNPGPESVSIAARILETSIEDDERVEQWLELLARLDESGVIKRKGAGRELLEAYNTL